MNDQLRDLKEHISYVREQMGDDGTILFATGAGLCFGGLLFGFTVLRDTLIDSGWIHYPEVLRMLMPWDAVILFLTAFIGFAVYFKRTRRQFETRWGAMSATARAMWASWASVGFGHLAASIAMSKAGLDLSTVTLFAFWATGWCVFWAIYQQLWMAIIAITCYLFAIATGMAWGTPAVGLITASGFIVVAAIPGLLLIRFAKEHL
jgi:hypothetical protein